MAYLIDRERALAVDAIVAILAVKRPRARSCAVLRDGALYYTQTRPRTFARWLSSRDVFVGLGASEIQQR